MQLISIAAIFLVATAAVATSNRGVLRMVQVLYRHGDRTPIETYPTDPWDAEEYWPEGMGQLTNHGKLQHFALGEWLRNRYSGTAVLKPEYDSRDSYIRSTDLDRALTSATANVAALYPAPNGEPNGPHNPSWKPIPIFTVPQAMDDVLHAKRKCPEYDRLHKELELSFIAPLLARVPNMVGYLEHHSGAKLGNELWRITALSDVLTIEQQRNMTWPPWADRLMRDERGAFWRLANLAWRIDTLTPPMARLKYGWLLAEILHRFAVKSTGQLRPDRGLWVYSGHDTTISGLLNMMGLWRRNWKGPSYASVLLFELWSVRGESAVKVLFRKGWDTMSLRNANKAEVLVLPGCEELCPLWRMQELLAEVLPTGSFEEECGLV